MSTAKTSKIVSWIKAARLRTLPLALSSVIMGSFLAIGSGDYLIPVIILSLVTTLILQILSNFANDYGDSIKGTDNEHRLGPLRTVQSGEITHQEMKRGILV
ncbi:MAG: 1,4-dihydroxy-2-naphthoate octaprenyltransferase, partial [Bacteroidales bacterium]